MTQSMSDERTHSTAFSIVAVEAYHLVAGDSYWRGFRQESRTESERFVLKPGWRTVYARNVETAIIKVTLDDGSIGYGEATEPICPEVICRLAGSLIAPVLGGMMFGHPAELWDQAYELQRGRGHGGGYYLHAMAALDLAVWDALGCRNGVPVAKLLTERPRTSVPVYLSGLRRGTVEERVELLGELVAGGLSAVKIFANGDTAETMAEIDALRAGVPGAWDVMVDALWSYERAPDAAEARRRLAERQVHWLECPLLPEDLDGHLVLASGQGAPVALGEHFFTHYQSAPWLSARALQVFQPDVGRTGISDGLRQAALAREQGIAVTAHMGSGSPIVQAAGLQFWAALDTATPCEYQFELADLLPGTFDTAWRYADGGLTLPERPGLGVEVDVDALAAAAAGVESWRA